MENRPSLELTTYSVAFASRCRRHPQSRGSNWWVTRRLGLSPRGHSVASPIVSSVVISSPLVVADRLEKIDTPFVI